MNGQLVFGILILLALVGYQSAARFYQSRQTQIWWQRAKEAWIARDLPETAHALTKCLKWSPLSVAPRVLLGTVLAQQGKLKEAEEHLRMAAELQPKEPDGHIELGLFYATLCENRFADAAAALKTAIASGDHVAARLKHDRRFDSVRDVPELREIL